MNKCAFNGCENNQAVRGYCRGHYAQLAKGKELKPLRKYKKGVTDSGRVCTGCNNFKPWDEFYDHSVGINGKSPRCMSCVKHDAVERYQISKE